MNNENHQPNLWEDLDKYADELFTKRDLEDGKKIISELVGIGTLGFSLWTILTVTIEAVEIAVIPSFSVVLILGKILYRYGQLGAEDRKAIRAVLKWIKIGFNLTIFD